METGLHIGVEKKKIPENKRVQVNVGPQVGP